MIATTTCNTCGTSLDPTRSAGRCAACLFATAFDVPDDDTLGRIGDHELLEEIARGGMGVVYRARQRVPERVVALKTMRGTDLDSPAAMERFRHEARAMADLDHAAILPVFTFGEHDCIPYFTMKLATGGTLAERMGNYAGQWREIAALVATVADAVQHAHARAVLHRDLKPGNILFDDAGNPFVADFGIAKLLRDPTSDLTRTMSVLGTPHYLAPEIAAQDARSATTASDVWSLGVILYELLAQRRPFAADSVPAMLREIAETQPAPLPGVPRDLATIASKALAKSPAQRFASARELAEDLRRWLGGEPIVARPVSPVERMRLWAWRNPAVTLLSATLLVGGIFAGWVLFNSNRELASALHKTERAQGEAEMQLAKALIAEADGLLRSEDLRARERSLEIVRQLQKMGYVHEDARNIAIRALATLGITESKGFPTNFATEGGHLDYSSDLGRYAVSAGAKAGFQICSTADGESPSVVKAKSGCYSARISADDRWVAVRLRDNRLMVRSMAKPQEPVFETPAGGNRWDLPLDFHPSGAYWFYSTGDESIRRHDAAHSSNGEDEVVGTAPSAIHGLTFSPDGARIAVKFDPGWGVWDVAARKWIWQRTDALATDQPIWSPRGNAVGAGLQQFTRFTVVDAATGADLADFFGHKNSLSVAAFHPTRPLLATIGWDRQLLIWDTTKGVPLARHPAMPRGVDFSADGNRIAFSPGRDGTSVFGLALPEVWHQWECPPPDGDMHPTAMDISADGNSLLTVSRGVFRFWDIKSRRMVVEFKNPSGTTIGPTFWLSPTAILNRTTASGELFTLAKVVLEPSMLPNLANFQQITEGNPDFRTGDGRGIVMRRFDGGTDVWNPDQSVRLRIAAPGFGRVVDVTPDNQLVVIEGTPAEVRRAVDGAKVCTIKTDGKCQLRFSPSGTALVAAHANSTVVFDPLSGAELARWPTKMEYSGIGCIAFSPDGSLLAVCHSEGEIELRETRHWKRLALLSTPGPPNQSSGLFLIAWTPDSTRIVVFGNGSRTFDWDIARLSAELAKLGLGWSESK